LQDERLQKKKKNKTMNKEPKVGDYRILESKGDFTIQLYDYHEELEIRKWWQPDRYIKVLGWKVPNLQGKSRHKPIIGRMVIYDAPVYPCKSLAQAKEIIKSWTEEPEVIIHEI
jgi:hypothetical protein